MLVLSQRDYVRLSMGGKGWMRMGGTGSGLVRLDEVGRDLVWRISSGKVGFACEKLCKVG